MERHVLGALASFSVVMFIAACIAVTNTSPDCPHETRADGIFIALHYLWGFPALFIVGFTAIDWIMSLAFPPHTPDARG